MARLADLEAPVRKALPGLVRPLYETPHFPVGPPLSELGGCNPRLIAGDSAAAPVVLLGQVHRVA